MTHFKKLFTLILALTTFSAMAGIRFFDSNNVELGAYSEVKCASSISCSQSSGKLLVDLSSAVVGSGTLVGFRSSVVAATATTITAAQCGSTFINSGAVVINLPLASTVIGCKLTFATNNATNFDVNPNDADQILVLTNALGDAIRNATLGNTVTLQAIAANEWVSLGGNGTYTDIN